MEPAIPKNNLIFKSVVVQEILMRSYSRMPDPQGPVNPWRTIIGLDLIGINPTCLNYTTCENVDWVHDWAIACDMRAVHYPQYGASGFTNVWEQHANWENPIGFIQERGMCPNSLWPHMLSAEHIFCFHHHRNSVFQQVRHWRKMLYRTKVFIFSHGLIALSLNSHWINETFVMKTACLMSSALFHVSKRPDFLIKWHTVSQTPYMGCWAMCHRK